MKGMVDCSQQSRGRQKTYVDLPTHHMHHQLHPVRDHTRIISVPRPTFGWANSSSIGWLEQRRQSDAHCLTTMVAKKWSPHFRSGLVKE